MAEEILQKQMTLLPEYQEKYLKDLLANVFQVDEESGTISGVAATSPLYGQPVFQMDGGGTTLDPALASLDEDGNQIQYYQTNDGNYTTDSNLAARDQYGEPIFAVEGGVAEPDVIGFTDAQVEALNRATGQGGFEGMMDSYQPYLDKASGVFDSGVSAADASQGRYDPRGQVVYDTDPTTGVRTPRLDANGEPIRQGGYKDFYDPYVEDVIDASQADIMDALNVQLNQMGSDAAGSGAFGSRYGVERGTAIGKSSAEAGKLGAQLRSAGFTGAQEQAQSAFENQQKRGQNAGQLFATLGTGIGALGEAQQSMGFQDVNSLFNVGQLEQKQLQSQFDVQRAGQLEEAYEPFSRFSYMRDILQGVPSSSTSLSNTGTPQASPLSNILQGANIYSNLQGGSNIFGGLGSLKNTSGA